NLPSIASQLGGATNGVITFDIPKTDQTTSIIGIDTTIHICPNGPNERANPPECTVEINIAKMKLHIDAITPHSVKITGTVPVRLQKLPVDIGILGVVGLGAGGCNGGAPKFDYKDIPVDVELPLINTTTPPRDGYTKVDVDNAKINLTLSSDDVAICVDCGF